MPWVRTKLNPAEDLWVTEAGHADLAAKGLLLGQWYGAVPADPDDLRLARLVRDPASATSVELRVALGRVGPPVRAVGAICFTWDDGFASWQTVRAMANARGQKHTFCVTQGNVDTYGAGGTLPSAFIAAAHADGHEIAAHTVTHTKVTDQTAAQRVVEYEQPRSYIEGLIGAGTVTTFVYPFGSASAPAGRSVTTDRELFLRYDRLLDTSPIRAGALPLGDQRFVIPRLDYDPADPVKHARVLELIRYAAKHRVVVSFYSHDVTTQAAWDRLTEAMNLAQSLGVPCLTTREAFPAVPSAVMDPGFESAEALSSYWSASGAYEVVTRTPPVGLHGSKALHLTTATTGDTSYVEQLLLYPVVAGRTYRVSSLYEVNAATAIAGGGRRFYTHLKWYGAEQSLLSTGLGAALVAETPTQSVDDILAPAGAAFARVGVVLTGVTLGEAWVHRIDVAEGTSLPAYA